MSQVLLGPNGRPMIMIVRSNRKQDADVAEARVVTNMKWERIFSKDDGESIEELDRTAGQLKTDLGGMTPNQAATLMQQLFISDSGITLRWSEVKQIPAGPHAGDWYIFVPSRPERRAQRHPLSGAIQNAVASEWTGVQTVEMNPVWFQEPGD